VTSREVNYLQPIEEIAIIDDAKCLNLFETLLNLLNQQQHEMGGNVKQGSFVVVALSNLKERN
jgi:hypothetical protein